jgi:hypothetical protein
MFATSTIATAQSPYIVGEISNTEQYYLELVNRARMYPDIEGRILSEIADSSARLEYAFFNVDMDAMETEMALYPPLPPLAPNSRLSAMAYDHAMDMLSNEFQGHKGSDGSNLRSRAESAGYYDWKRIGENAFAYSRTPSHTHTSFEVDWGSGPFGMQNGRPHRENIHGPDFTEIGIARVKGSNGTVGPELVVQEFGDRDSATAFITGVVHFDLNGNRFYDPGEGIGGAIINANDTDFYAISSNSGGYALPVSHDGTYNVTFSIEGLPPFNTTVEVINGENTKLDYRPRLTPPRLSGKEITTAGVASPYTVTTSPGTIGSNLLICRIDSTPPVIGAETDSANYSLTTDTQYNAIQTFRTASGSAAFHLAHPNINSGDQTLTLNHNYIPGTKATLSFKSLLGQTDSGQLAKVQVNAGTNDLWSDVWLREGNSRPDSAFAAEIIDLSDYAGQWIQIRFVLFVGAGYVIEGADANVGWFIDDITFEDIEKITDIRSEDASDGVLIDLVLPEPETVRLFAQARTAGSDLPPTTSINVRSYSNDFQGWKQRTLASAQDRPLTRLPGERPETSKFQQYALEHNNGTRPQPKLSADGQTLTLNYATDRGRRDVMLIPQIKIGQGDWIFADALFKPKGLRDQLVRVTNGTLERRRATFKIGATRDIQLRLAIVDLTEE